MQRWRGYDAAPGGWGRSVVTIGVFDGVHKGHQATIGHTVARARELGVQSVVVTFDPHPAEVVRPGSHPAVLTEQARKAELIEALGVDVLCVVPFTPEFSRLPAEAFVHDVLVEHLHATLVVVGDNFRFGHRAAGDVALLERLGRTFGFAVEGSPLVAEDGTVFSSTYIRSCVDAGDVTAAAAALGRPHRLEGVVVRGDQRGRELGFPTANLLCHRYAAVPADGIYAARMLRRGQPEPLSAAVSIGTNPTFSGRERRVEAYVLDFDGDLYGERLALDFVAHVRGQIRFDSIEALVAQITEDVQRIRATLT
ncbi:bifunctional riboflavin kinase/FAD synthetase [Micromonospora endophytica]|uniref:Riboflavin biosynthesis protein n=1 Tax=Micromonospora endophytica TaxID=515350 RepID=A0A2W2DTV6_9ACTN|nr:bifunctional riboflavin kinase/FAD synthetase [Micromonospora endophytica]PZF96233.1 bifunctional riboflavin kinase/FAD synthetase [Micromonospora endophytica]RIW50347.1 bifunctional riboflavin kinase/FAD synthetase [Micromonospora endophytica]BCJ57857.1 riboflavin biosynthesis protein [Micromonospora endophytica]